MNVPIDDALVHERMRDTQASAERVRRIRTALRAAAEQIDRVRPEPLPRHDGDEQVFADQR